MITYHSLLRGLAALGTLALLGTILILAFPTAKATTCYELQTLVDGKIVKAERMQVEYLLINDGSEQLLLKGGTRVGLPASGWKLVPLKEEDCK